MRLKALLLQQLLHRQKPLFRRLQPQHQLRRPRLQRRVAHLCRIIRVPVPSLTQVRYTLLRRYVAWPVSSVLT
ncbi:MAG: hypothetical protein Sw2LagTSB_05510 [Shewanella algae]